MSAGANCSSVRLTKCVFDMKKRDGLSLGMVCKEEVDRDGAGWLATGQGG